MAGDPARHVGHAALVWSGLAVAIAVMIVIWNNPEQGAKREIAQQQAPRRPAAGGAGGP